MKVNAWSRSASPRLRDYYRVRNRTKVKRLGWGDTYVYIWLGLGLGLGLRLIYIYQSVNPIRIHTL